MIALNEIINKKEEFEKKYSLMGYDFDLQKIITLEQKFILLDRKNNENRAECNKLCEQVAKLINTNKDPNTLIKTINKLDKKINKSEKKTYKSMGKINAILKRLPNPALENNKLNLVLNTKFNSEFTADDFAKKLTEISTIKDSNLNYKQLINSIRKLVIKAENLPQIYKLKSTKSKQEYVILSDSNAIKLYENLVNNLFNSKYLIKKSIKQLKQDCALEHIAILGNDTRINLEFIGEYISREISLKLYDKNIDMTKFVNIIKITIKGHRN